MSLEGVQGKFIVRHSDYEFHVQEKSQSTSKGFGWATLGLGATAFAASITAATASVAIDAFGTKDFNAGDYITSAILALKKFKPQVYCSEPIICGPINSFANSAKNFLVEQLPKVVPYAPYALAGTGVVALATSFFAIRSAGSCFRNAFYHFGDSHAVVRGEKKIS